MRFPRTCARTTSQHLAAKGHTTSLRKVTTLRSERSQHEGPKGQRSAMRFPRTCHVSTSHNTWVRKVTPLGFERSHHLASKGHNTWLRKVTIHA
eukprot:1092258-Rhodomonas_salina.1